MCIIVWDGTLHSLGPTPLTMRGPNWSVPQCIGELSQIPIASQATMDMTVSLNFMVRSLVHCLDKGVQLASHKHPNCPNVSVADIADCVTSHAVYSCTIGLDYVDIKFAILTDPYLFSVLSSQMGERVLCKLVSRHIRTQNCCIEVGFTTIVPLRLLYRVKQVIASKTTVLNRYVDPSIYFNNFLHRTGSGQKFFTASATCPCAGSAEIYCPRTKTFCLASCLAKKIDAVLDC